MQIDYTYPTVTPPSPTSVTLTLTATEWHDLMAVIDMVRNRKIAPDYPDTTRRTHNGCVTHNIYGLLNRFPTETINGVTLTRAQIEQATADLNRKTPVTKRIRFAQDSGTIPSPDLLASVTYRMDGPYANEAIYLTKYNASGAEITWSVEVDSGGGTCLIGRYTVEE